MIQNMYGFSESGNLRLVLEIQCSFCAPALFEVFEENDSFTVYWRKCLKDRDLINQIIADPILNSKKMPLNELYKSPEYSEFLNKILPVSKYVLDERQKSIVTSLLENGLDKEVKKHYGHDGHSYELKLYRPNEEIFRCWCVVPDEWKDFKNVIDLLVNEISGLDDLRYGYLNKK